MLDNDSLQPFRQGPSGRTLSKHNRATKVPRMTNLEAFVNYVTVLYQGELSAHLPRSLARSACRVGGCMPDAFSLEGQSRTPATASPQRGIDAGQARVSVT
jgi:hypothetical protein